VLVALTGTPGTGKSSVAAVLDGRGYYVLHVDRLAAERGLYVGRDPVRGSMEVDVDALRREIRVSAKTGFLVSHYAHLLDVNLAVVLRCHPRTLAERLRGRGWPDAKVRENVEAEAIDVITQEAAARLARVYEVDTTSASPETTANAVLDILRGRTDGREPGSIDWTGEVLSWF